MSGIGNSTPRVSTRSVPVNLPSASTSLDLAARGAGRAGERAQAADRGGGCAAPDEQLATAQAAALSSVR